MTLSSSSMKEIQEAARLHMEALEEHERLRDADHSTEVEDAFFNQLSTHKVAAAAYRAKVSPSVVLAMAEEILRLREALEYIAHFTDADMDSAITLHRDMRNRARAALPSTTDEGRTE